ncbi:hypothetical protein OBE_08924, partial [human gut metagenome]
GIYAVPLSEPEGKEILVGKFTLVNLSTPRNASSGFAKEKHRDGHLLKYPEEESVS